MSISIGDNYSSFYLSQSQNTVNSKANSLESTLGNLENADDEELMDACKSFESYMLEQCFKALESTVQKDDEEDGSITNYMEYFGDTLFKSIAETSTEKDSLGIAQMLYESMKRNT